MRIIPPALFVALAAFCVWLAVRIVNRRERCAKWTLVAVIGLPVLYVASFGPACWLAGCGMLPIPIVANAYPSIIRTVLTFWRNRNKPVSRLVYSYLRLGCDRGARVPLECWHSGEIAP